MASSNFPKIISWDYTFAPNAQKSRNYLTHQGLPYACVLQPNKLPRPDLLDLGITYRRIPVIAIGKDVYCDNSGFLAAAQYLLSKEQLPQLEKRDSAVAHSAAASTKGTAAAAAAAAAAATGQHSNNNSHVSERSSSSSSSSSSSNLPKPLRESIADKAYEAWAYRAFFLSLPTIPLDMLGPVIVKDRKTVFPSLSTPGIETMQDSAKSEFRTLLQTLEHEFLTGDGGFIAGESTPGLADINVVWVVKWVLETVGLGQQKGFGQHEFPKTYKWIQTFPSHDPVNNTGVTTLEAAEAKQALLQAPYTAPDIGVDSQDILGLAAGELVKVEPNDSEIDTHPQRGRLVGLNSDETVVELDNGVRLHFPKVGYLVRRV